MMGDSEVFVIGSARLINSDCFHALLNMKPGSIDSVITDPPYGIGFMGKNWDYGVPGVAYWSEIFRVLKPGGHLLSFGGSRTYHRLACAIEDAGFEIRDQIQWIYGSGFPKSLDVSKAIDAKILTGGSHSRNIKNAIQQRPGESRETSTLPNNGVMSGERRGGVTNDNAATDAARQWQGWGTALKPAHEPIVLARKPLIGTVAGNVLTHGTGAINVDGCRIGFESDSDKDAARPGGKATAKSGSLAGKAQDGFVISGPVVEGERLYWSNDTGWGSRCGATIFRDEGVIDPVEATGREPAVQRTEFIAVQGIGRWPANVIHDGSDEVIAAFHDAKCQQGDLKDQDHQAPRGSAFGQYGPKKGHKKRAEESKSAARFFYCPKASRKDRGEGNNHPTVKPTELMRYLCRLVTPPGGIVLDPFMGSGTTGVAAIQEGFAFCGIEKEAGYFEIAKSRIRLKVNSSLF